MEVNHVGASDKGPLTYLTTISKELNKTATSTLDSVTTKLEDVSSRICTAKMMDM